MPEELMLLPCPACGGEGLFYQSDNYSSKMNKRFYISCLQCELRGPIECAPDLAAEAWNALPRALTWTTEPPKVPGLYLFRAVFDGEPSGNIGLITVHENPRYEWSEVFQWCPVPMPKEHTNV